ncbi:Abi-alpha family protein [Sphingobacterium sp. ML3W]|uniref:Abi-alpha family protein n=1 Tax=Sphingobacterium sp. ML3W TaxID=1538644 RepID=UPI00130E4385|nr:Abi-alpha family protein [Sphingobacterium sp. ML3W]
MKKIDISSTVLEKGIDLAKGFVEKLIYPSAEELGLLFKDGVAKWRFNNQIQTLIKTQALCEKHNINPKTISTKLLYPLLEYASLEENEKLQDKWAALLANMVDSNQNIENHVFPYLLSQLSVQEFDVLEHTFKKKEDRIKKFTKELDEHLASYEQILNDIDSKIDNCEEEIDKYRINNLANPQNYQNTYDIHGKLDELKARKSGHIQKQSRIEKQMNDSELIPSQKLRNFEMSNLIRLGIVKEVVHSYGYIDSKRITVNKGNGYHEYSEDYINLEDVTVNIERDVIENELTELGDLFMKACQGKGEFNE